MQKSMINPSKILVLQTAFIGDVILTTPFLRHLKDIFPKAKIDILCIPQTKQVLQNNPFINEIIIFDKRIKVNKLASFLNTILQIKANKYDLGISIQSSVTSSLLMVLGKIKIKHGFSRQKFLNMSVNHAAEKGAHKIAKILRLLEPFSDKKFDHQTEIYYKDSDLKIVDKHLSENNILNDKLIAIAPGSVWFTKKWPKDYFVELVKLLENNKSKIVLTGGQQDFEICNEIAEKTNAVNFAGKFSIPQSAALIKKCVLIITNDSAPLHIANAVQTDVVAIFGPTVKSLGFYPFRQNDIVIEKNLDCRPCGRHGGNSCPLKHFSCMLDLTPKLVYKKMVEKYKIKLDIQEVK